MQYWTRFSALCALVGMLALPALAPAADPPPGGIDSVLGANRGQSDFLPPDEAFKLEASAVGPDRVQLTWAIAEGYYLYRSRLKVKTSTEQAQLGELVLPTGDTKTDEYFGEQEVYHMELAATLAVA